MKIIYPVIAFLLCSITVVSGQQDSILRTLYNTYAYSVEGAHNAALAHNNPAKARDITASFSNPAALAFLPIREISFSFSKIDVLDRARTNGESYKEDTRTFHFFQEAGGMVSLPASRGGMSVSFYKSTPYLLNDVTKSTTREFRYDGHINYWSSAMGVQVAPSLALGGTISLINGERIITQKQNNITSDVKDTYKIGYEIRIGCMYSYQNMLRFGARFVLPANIPFEQMRTDIAQSPQWEGTLRSSYSSAFGFSVKIPYAVLSAQIDGRFPYDFVLTTQEIPGTSAAAYYKMGFGAGLDVFVNELALSIGYNWNEFDPFLFVYDYKGFDYAWSQNEVHANGGIHTLAGGVRYLFKNDMAMSVSYENRVWELVTRNVLYEKYRVGRLTAALSFRF